MRIVVVAAGLAMLLASAYSSMPEEPSMDEAVHALDELQDDLMDVWKYKEEAKVESKVDFKTSRDTSLGEDPSVDDSSSDKVSAMRDNSMPEFPEEKSLNFAPDSPAKRRAMKRLQKEEALYSKINPKVHVENLGSSAENDECIDDPQWAKDCVLIAEHCGTSIVMKARCRKTCGCGPKLDLYIPSLKGAPGLHPGAAPNGTKPATTLAGNTTQTHR